MLKEKKKVLPVVDHEHRVVGLYVWKDVDRIQSGSNATFNVDARGQLRVGAAVGVGRDALERLEKLTAEHLDVVVIDTAHGDTKSTVTTLQEIKAAYPHLDVVAGNVTEAASAERLTKAGADGIKVGQGPGSICTTRVIAGIGCPQVTAVYQCAQAVEKYGIPVCADGGIKYSGDIPIAIGAGAHTVMLGSLFAGTDEAPGELVFIEGRQWKSYRGMGSLDAMAAHRGSRERYGQGDVAESGKLIPEGIEGIVPYRGKLRDVLIQYVGGLKHGMGYVGARTIAELHEKADFHRITPAGQNESHPHDIYITKDAPNYQRK